MLFPKISYVMINGKKTPLEYVDSPNFKVIENFQSDSKRLDFEKQSNDGRSIPRSKIIGSVVKVAKVDDQISFKTDGANHGTPKECGRCNIIRIHIKNGNLEFAKELFHDGGNGYVYDLATYNNVVDILDNSWVFVGLIDQQVFSEDNLTVVGRRFVVLVDDRIEVDESIRKVKKFNPKIVGIFEDSDKKYKNTPLIISPACTETEQDTIRIDKNGLLDHIEDFLYEIKPVSKNTSPSCPPNMHLENGVCVPNEPVPDTEKELQIISTRLTNADYTDSNKPENILDSKKDTWLGVLGIGKELLLTLIRPSKISSISLNPRKDDKYQYKFSIGNQEFVTLSNVQGMQNFKLNTPIESDQVSVILNGTTDPNNPLNEIIELRLHGVYKEEGPDTKPPFVVKATPEGNAVDSTKVKQIVITFNEPLDATSVINGELSADKTSIVIPIVLEFDKEYSIKVENIRDVSGNTMISPFELKFKTAKEGTTPPPPPSGDDIELLYPNGRVVFKTTGNKEKVIRGGDPAGNGIRFNADHKFKNYLVKTRVFTGKNQKLIEMKTDGPCFPAGYPVLTSKGLIPIEQIKLDDMVYTHAGRFRKVTRLFKRDYNDTVYSVKSFGSNFETTATKEHPFFVNNGEWKESKNLSDSDFSILTVPSITNDVSNIRIPYKKRHNVALKHNGKNFESYTVVEDDAELVLELNTELLTLIGYYLAEGHLTKSEKYNEYRRIVFSFGKSEKEYGLALEAFNSAQKLGFNPSVKLSKCGYRVTIGSIPLATWMFNNFGKLAEHKSIPQWVIELPKEKLKVILEKYLNGDGYKVNTRKDMYRCNSTSKNLLMGMMLISLKLGFKPSISELKRKPTHIIEGRTVNQNTLYELIINKNTEVTKYLESDSIHYKQRIKTVLPKHFSGSVYNIEVDEDNSYCVNNHIVHNCHGCGGHPAPLPIGMWYEPHFDLTTGKSSMNAEAPHSPRHDYHDLANDFTVDLNGGNNEKWIGYIVAAYTNAQGERVILQAVNQNPDTNGRYIVTIQSTEKGDGKLFPSKGYDGTVIKFPRSLDDVINYKYGQGFEAEIRMHGETGDAKLDESVSFVYEIIPPN